jgi:hypothetical protein
MHCDVVLSENLTRLIPCSEGGPSLYREDSYALNVLLKRGRFQLVIDTNGGRRCNSKFTP